MWVFKKKTAVDVFNGLRIVHIVNGEQLGQCLFCFFAYHNQRVLSKQLWPGWDAGHLGVSPIQAAWYSDIITRQLSFLDSDWLRARRIWARIPRPQAGYMESNDVASIFLYLIANLENANRYNSFSFERILIRYQLSDTKSKFRFINVFNGYGKWIHMQNTLNQICLFTIWCCCLHRNYERRKLNRK